jgi:threonine/homoserine/homoserine lactone efflux protein/ketosteroid isomerase-like protein
VTSSPDLWLFFALVFGVIVLPGMDMAYVATNALVGGLRSGMTAVAGIVAGGIVHVAVAATGIAVLLTVWPAAFNAVLLAGAAYMVWVGWSLLRAGNAPASEGGASGPPTPATAAGVFGRAMLTCLLNPKAYAFMLAVFPAFIHTDQRSLPLQAVILSAITAATQVAVYGTVAVAAAGTRRFAGVGESGQRWMLRVTGPLLMAGAALTLALGWKPASAQTTAPAASSASASAPDGSRDFDFLIGDWRIVNRKRLGILKNDDRWETFEAASHVRALPGGIGNQDDFTAPQWRPGYVGVTVRLFSPQSKRWSLYWMSSRDAGLDPATNLLQPPVIGEFRGDTGVFEGDDRFEGKPIRVRYTWRRVDADHATWEQAFSPDGGRSWETNWTMALSRERHDAVAEILAVEDALCQAYLHGDVQALQRDLSDDFTLINGRGEVGTKAEDLETARTGSIRYTRFENRDMNVRLHGDDAAIVTGITNVAGVTGGKQVEVEVRFTDTFVRENGRWRLAAGHVSGIRPKR